MDDPKVINMTSKERYQSTIEYVGNHTHVVDTVKIIKEIQYIDPPKNIDRTVQYIDQGHDDYE